MKKNIRLIGLLIAVLVLLSQNLFAGMLGDTITINRAYPNLETDYTAPVSTTVVAGNSDITSPQTVHYYINPEDTHIEFDFVGSTGFAGSETIFDGLIFTGFSQKITNAYILGINNLSIAGLDFGDDFIHLNFTGRIDSSSYLDIGVDFVSVSLPSSVLLMLFGLFFVLRGAKKKQFLIPPYK